jgi:RNA polymerase sigma-70 factor (ECF subfamily)
LGDVSSVPTNETRREGQNSTLGELLYADRQKQRVPESDWVALVRCVGTGDRVALHALYERTARLVFALILRITGSQQTAEELTLDVFQHVWQRTSEYDAARDTVLGWIMNEARSRAIARLQSEPGRAEE